MPPVAQLAPSALRAWLDDPARPRPFVLDVREPWEVAICRIPGSVSIPMNQLISRWPELDAQQPTVVVCHHGMRSLQVSLFLARNGFAEVLNLQGGVAAWADQVDPSMARY
jgi:rhodanese-related sulfurtransferase